MPDADAVKKWADVLGSNRVYLAFEAASYAWSALDYIHKTAGAVDAWEFLRRIVQRDPSALADGPGGLTRTLNDLFGGLLAFAIPTAEETAFEAWKDRPTNQPVMDFVRRIEEFVHVISDARP